MAPLSRSARSLSVLLCLCGGASSAHAQSVVVSVDGSVRHQTVEGYGATTVSLAYGNTDNVPPALRAQAIEALYGQVKVNMGSLSVAPFEASASNPFAPANDDNDPGAFSTTGFNWKQSDNMLEKVVRPGKPFGFDDFWLGPALSETFEFAWAKPLRASNYNLYLEECAEHVVALALHWRDAYGINPPLMQLWNEPLGGNREISGATVQQLADIVARAGARLRQAGLSTRFVIPADESEQGSLDEATAILGDAAARPYVGAIAYHPYPYGSTYASVPNILATSGAGKPDAAKVLVRQQLKALGAQYGVPVFMVEVSHSKVAFGDFAGLRGRAIQIHDEMVYADASAFFGMNAMWDTVTNDQHYVGRANPGLYSESDTLVLIEDGAGKTPGVFITEMGRAIGHYARWVPRGSVRVEASSPDPLVQVTAFEEARDGRLALVLINNATSARVAQIRVQGLSLKPATAVEGEQSTAGNLWKRVTAGAASPTGFTVTLPALSVTSAAAWLAGRTDGGSAPDGGGGNGLPDSGIDAGGSLDDGGSNGLPDPSSDGGQSSPPDQGSSSGCGCSAGPAGFELLATGLLALAALRRRRALAHRSTKPHERPSHSRSEPTPRANVLGPSNHRQLDWDDGRNALEVSIRRDQVAASVMGCMGNDQINEVRLNSLSGERIPHIGDQRPEVLGSLDPVQPAKLTGQERKL